MFISPARPFSCTKEHPRGCPTFLICPPRQFLTTSLDEVPFFKLLRLKPSDVSSLDLKPFTETTRKYCCPPPTYKKNPVFDHFHPITTLWTKPPASLAGPHEQPPNSSCFCPGLALSLFPASNQVSWVHVQPTPCKGSCLSRRQMPLVGHPSTAPLSPPASPFLVRLALP